MKVGIQGHFDSMHFLPGHPKCSVPHGHTYTVEVSVTGPVRDGMVIDFGRLKSALGAVLQAYDHQDLNQLLPFPSCENIALDLHRRLQEEISLPQLTVRVWEGKGKWAEYES